MAIFAEFAGCKNSDASADLPEAQALAAKHKAHITANYYTCTDEILSGLGKMYVADERFKKNIDKDIALAAMKGANSSWGFRELPRDLQRDPDVLRAFVSNLDEDAREGILCRINLPNAVLQDDDLIRNIVDFCSCCETCPYSEPVCIWRNESLIARAQELCDYSISIESDEDDWFEEDEEE